MWQNNARDVSKVYSKFNRRIKFDRIYNLMLTHLSTTLNEATSIIQGNCEASATNGEITLDHIHMMSDYLASKSK